MPEDQPKQPSTNPTPEQSSPTPTTSRTAGATQPFVKAQTIKILRGTIQLLQGVVENLEAEPPVQLPPTTSVSEQVVLEPGKVTTQAPQAETAEAVPISPIPATLSPLERFGSGWIRFIALWNATLAKIRSLLPESLNQKLSDTALSGVVAAVLLILLWTTAALLPGKQPAEVAVAPSPTSPDVEMPTPPIAEAPTPPVVETPTPSPGIEAPAELEAPKAPEPIETAPPPPPELTPEQSLIAAIQNQVGEITSKYANGLIQSIEANFPASRLQVKVGEDWYNLSASQQDKLAAQMFQRSKELDFAQLEITDSQGTLLARSPVVGSQMVILKRQALAANL